MASHWYYARDGQQSGPVSEAELHRLVRDGQLQGDDLVWRDGMAGWERAAAMGIGNEVKPPPVPPASNPVPPPPVSPPALSHRGPGKASRPARRGRSTARHRSHDPRWLIWGGSGLLAISICTVFVLSTAHKSRTADRSIARREAPATRNQTVTPAPTQHPEGEPSPPAERPARQRPLGFSTTPAAVAPVASQPEGKAVPDDATERALPDATAKTDNPKAASSTSGLADKTAEPPMKPAASSRPSGAKVGSQPAAAMSKRKASQTLYQRIDIQRRPTFSIQGLTTPQNIHYELSSKLTIDSSADGQRAVTQVVENTKLLAADDLSRASFVKSLEALKRRQFTYKLNARGTVVEFTGYKTNLASLPADLLSGSGFMVTSVIDEDGWKELAALTFLVPDLDAQQGEAWKRQMAHDWGDLGRWSGTTTFSWAPANRNDPSAERINYRHDMKYTAPATGESKLPFKINAANFMLRDASGSVAYDREKQRVLTVDETFDVSGSVTVELAGTPVEIQLTERQQIRIQLSDQKPR